MPERSRREGQLFPWLCVISLHSLTGIFWILFVAGAPVGAPAGASAGAPVAFPGRTSVDWLPVTGPSPSRRKVELQQIPRNLSDQSTRSKMRRTRQEVFCTSTVFAIFKHKHKHIPLFCELNFAMFSYENQSRQHTNLLRSIFYMYSFILFEFGPSFLRWVHFEEEKIHFLSRTTFVKKTHFFSSDHLNER